MSVWLVDLSNSWSNDSHLCSSLKIWICFTHRSTIQGIGLGSFCTDLINSSIVVVEIDIGTFRHQHLSPYIGLGEWFMVPLPYQFHCAVSLSGLVSNSIRQLVCCVPCGYIQLAWFLRKHVCIGMDSLGSLTWADPVLLICLKKRSITLYDLVCSKTNKLW